MLTNIFNILVNIPSNIYLCILFIFYVNSKFNALISNIKLLEYKQDILQKEIQKLTVKRKK